MTTSSHTCHQRHINSFKYIHNDLFGFHQTILNIINSIIVILVWDRVMLTTIHYHFFCTDDATLFMKKLSLVRQKKMVYAQQQRLFTWASYLKLQKGKPRDRSTPLMIS